MTPLLIGVLLAGCGGSIDGVSNPTLEVLKPSVTPGDMETDAPSSSSEQIPIGTQPERPGSGTAPRQPRQDTRTETIRPAPTTTVKPPRTWVITCADGTRYELEQAPTSREGDELCAPELFPPPSSTSTTLAVPPQVTKVIATYAGGLDWLTNKGIATSVTCPTSTVITYAIYTDDGKTHTGTTEISAQSREAVVTLPTGRTVRFGYFLHDSGACVKSVYY